MFNNKKRQQFKPKEPKIFTKERLYSYGLWLIARRDYTVYELSEKMKKYQPDTSIIKETVDKMVTQGYVNDEKRATNIVNSYIRKESTYKIKRRLSEKGVSQELIEEVFETCINEDTEQESANNLIVKKFKIYNPELKQKYASYLASRGYSWDIISKSISYLKSTFQEE
jgi:regulatory protein